MSRKLSLLEKYEINIEKLDYGYIESCSDGSELEKIYKILLSNEEGCYPHLTETAKSRLAVVKPNSKYLRSEEKLQSRYLADHKVQEELNNGLGEFVRTFNKNCNANEMEEIQLDIELPSIPIRGENTVEEVPINQGNRDLMQGKIEEIRTESLSHGQLIELEAIHRNRGNNIYRAKEYKEAVDEYSNCIRIFPTPNGYNNRAASCE